MINKVILIGNLGADPDVRTLDSGTKVAKISIATNENYRDRKTNEWKTNTEWHNVVLWRFLAERAEKFLKKGSLVYIEGKLTSRKYQDQEGKDRYITEIVANSLKILDRREEGAGSGGYFPSDEHDPYTRKSGNQDTPSTSPGAGTFTDSDSEEDDDLPF